MKNIILFFLPEWGYGSIKFLNLALALRKKYNIYITPLILTSNKHVADLSKKYFLNCILFKPFYNYIKKIPIITKSSPIRLFIDLILFFFYRNELKPKIKKINPSWIIMPSDSSYNEYIVLSNLNIKTLIIQYTIDTINIDEEIKYFSYHYQNRRFSLFEKLIDRLIKLSPDYNSRFLSLNGPYSGSPLKHFVLKFYRLLPRNERKGGGNSKYLAVNGDEYINIYNKYGIPKTKMIVTGNPEHDDISEILSNKDMIMKKVFNHFNIGNKKLVILYLQPFRNKRYLNSIRLILNSLMRFKVDNYFLLKSHPRTKKSEYYYLEKEFDCKIIGDDTGFSNKELIISSYFTITQSSTVGLLALALNIPLITFNFNTIYPNFATDASIHCTRVSEFNEAVEALFNKNGILRKKAIEKGNQASKKYLKLDGKCVERIYNIIKQ